MKSERAVVFAATLLTALTRWFAIARTFWDWDEANFILALRHYDVTAHHPQPPGFPLFIGTAKVLTFLRVDDFRALQAVSVAASVAIVPVVWMLAKELDYEWPVAVSAALLVAFFPNVWIFGGTAFSDVPALVLAVAAAALLLRGRRSDAAYLWGAVVAAFAMGYRPQNVIVVALPFLLATISQWRRSAWRVVTAISVCAVIVALSYGVAAASSGGWRAYRAAVDEHQQFILRVDSFRAPDHPPMLNIIADFLVRPYRAPLANALVTLAAAAGGILALVRRRAGRWIAIAMFAPVALLSVFYLNWLSASRFAIAYAPLIALLAADGLAIAGRRIAPVLSLALVAVLITVTVPALRIVHSTDAPPVAAAQFIRQQRPRRLVVDSRLKAHADVLLADFERQPIEMTAIAPADLADPIAVLYAEGATGARSSRNFVRETRPLASFVRPRYFEATVVPMRDVASISGSTLDLPPLQGDGRLMLRLTARGRVTVRFNGRVIDTLTADGTVTRSYRLLSRSKAMNEVSVEPPAGIESFGWLPAF